MTGRRKIVGITRFVLGALALSALGGMVFRPAPLVAQGAMCEGPSSACSIWNAAATPQRIVDRDTNPVELGVKFRSDVDGFILGLRFYKGPTNTGPHVGNLWTSGGTLLASALYVAESVSGWQEVPLGTPVAITANTTYVASYHTTVGRYAIDNPYFTTGVDNPPLHALADGAAGGNGVYRYGAGGFPTQTWQAGNYWVDVVFATSLGGADTTAPTVTGVSPADGAVEVSTLAGPVAAFSEAVDPATVTNATFVLRDAGGVVVPATVSYAGATQMATLVPTAALAFSMTYTATVTTGVTDVAGNPLAAEVVWAFTTLADSGSCGPSSNPIACENSKPGNPASEWDVTGSGDSSIQGFATDISVDQGETVRFKVDTAASDYRLDIYRLGYYGGAGARYITTVQPSAALPQAQPACAEDPSTGLIDCGTWAESASWAVPADAVSGIYLAKLVRESGPTGASHIVFIVRDDDGGSELLFQTSDTTWQAYNRYGGNSLYVGAPAGRAYKVSYNRPFLTRGCCSEDWLFSAEYPMVRWLEANGYDVSYFAGVDTDRLGAELLEHNVFLSVGHDEYWSGGQRANMEAARAAGVHLGFFSGNEGFWKTRWEVSIDGSGTPYRTLVSYKETHANAKIDPLPDVWTGTWRDPRFSQPADGGRPENALTGTIFTVNAPATFALQVSDTDGKLRFWRNTTVATLAPGEVATLSDGTLGYEWDEALDNGFSPSGLMRLSATTQAVPSYLLDFGSTYGPGTATHSLTLYRHAGGALVFGAGTVQWSWGLDGTHDRGGSVPDLRIQQATVNLLADMGSQAGTLQTGLVAALASTDTVPPASTVTSPVAGATVTLGTEVTIAGTASDAGGEVGGVEVSVDGGTTWHAVTGRESWSYVWTPAESGSATMRSRAVDDSGNLEIPLGGVTVTVESGGIPPSGSSIWSDAAVPSQIETSDPNAVELGVKFRSDVDGVITGLRFYKGPTNTGPHVGNLWTSGGTLLASAPYVAESASGWQEVPLGTPVAITANTTYVASYHTTVGQYAVDNPYFTTGVDNPPLHALADGAAGGNGVYSYGAGGFPTQTWQASNYWVDVVFATSLED